MLTRWRTRTPLRTQLVLLVLGLAALAVALTAVTGAALLRQQLINSTDEQLIALSQDLPNEFERATGLDLSPSAVEPDNSGTGSASGLVSSATPTNDVDPESNSGSDSGSDSDVDSDIDSGIGSDSDPDDDSGPRIRRPGGGVVATGFLVQFYGPNGRYLGALPSPLLEDQAGPTVPRLTADKAEELDGEPFTAGSADGDWRVLVSAYPNGSLVVSAPLDGVQGTLAQLLLIDVIVGLILMAGIAGLAWYAVRASLKPLVQVENTAEAIAAGDLSQRVPSSDVRTEVGSLAASVNTMLTRIEDSFTAQAASEEQARASELRMRRFIGDASHELRTPLTSVRGFAELYRHGAVPDSELPRVMRRIEDEAARMGLLVEDLLLLARLDQQRPLAMRSVDLVALAADAVHDATVAGPDHPTTLSVIDGAEPTVVGDEARLRQVIGNLMANAVAHTPAGTPVFVRVAATTPGWATIEVRDEGPGMAPEVAARVFERFYRADESRARTGEGAKSGAGLGLSIVAALVVAHGGHVQVHSEQGRGSTFTVFLPREGAGAQDSGSNGMHAQREGFAIHSDSPA